MPNELADRLGRWLHYNLVFRPTLLVRGESGFAAALDELRAAQRDVTSAVEARQNLRLAAALDWAYRSVPYYGSRWPKGLAIDPRGVRETIAQIPTLPKADLQAHFADLQSTTARGRSTRKTTGGSTGQAVTVLKDRTALAREMAATWMAYGWYGVRPGDRYARFWGSPTTWSRRVRAAAVGLVTRRISVSAFAFGDEDLERYWWRVLRFRPAFLYGYVSMLTAFAGYLRSKGYDGRRLGLKVVIATSEVLTSVQRAELQEVFGAAVLNEYGCGEVGPIAYACEQGALHTMSENLYVELLRPDGTPAGMGEDGDVVVTDLWNRTMPLVRYRVGDFARWAEPCACGRGWPAFERVWGRAYDFVETPSGRRYHGEYLMYLFEDLRERGAGVAQFQVVQTGPDHLVVRLVSAENLDNDLIQRVRSIFTSRLPEMKVTIERVDSVPRSPSGKLRLIKNEWRERAP